MKSTYPKYTICYNAKKFCCEDISLIENYDQMIADYTQKWCCHHRREIDENKSKKQLIAEGQYYNVPAAELIFMTVTDHMKLHMKGKQLVLGRHQSEEAKLKISEAMSEAMKGLKFWNNGLKNVRARECPGPGYEPGRLKKMNFFLRTATCDCELCK